MWADGGLATITNSTPHTLSTGNHLSAAHKMAALSLLMDQSITTALMGCQHQFTEKKSRIIKLSDQRVDVVL